MTLSKETPAITEGIAPKPSIRLFDCGKFVGFRSQSTIEALYARGLVDLKRNRKGYCFAAVVRHSQTPKVNGDCQQVIGSTPAGQRYSYRDYSITGQPWDLKRLNGRRNGLNYAPREVLPAFTAVVRSCMK